MEDIGEDIGADGDQGASRGLVRDEPPASGAVESLLTFATRDLSQEVQLFERSDGQAGVVRDIVVVQKTELHPVTQEYVTSSRRFVTSASVVDMDSRFYNDFTLVLKDGDNLRVERWILTDREGEWSASLPTPKSETPLGVPVETGSSSVFIKGQRWTEPSSRAPYPPEGRSRLQSLPWDGSYAEVAVDPDGRYYVLAVGGEIRQFATTANAIGQSIATAAGTGFDLQRVNSMYVVHTHSFGRVVNCAFEPTSIDDLDDLALIDSENDGVFESTLRVPRANDFADIGVILDDISRMFTDG